MEESAKVVSRRRFVGGLAAGGAVAALGYVTLRDGGLLSQSASASAAPAPPLTPQITAGGSDYDSLAKLANNENPWGPPESVLNAMTNAMKYSNRYGYPDGGIVKAIAEHHGVKEENILLGAGSGEILEVVGLTYLAGGKKVIGAAPSYDNVYSHVTSIKAEAIKLPLLPDYRQDIPAMIRATNKNYREVGFVYMCNPNNPTGRVVTKSEIKQLVDGVPEDMPILIDEAYHHFVDNRDYATSIPYVLEGRRVIVARTFSKISALAGMRLGYAVAPADIIARMRPYSTGTINALVKWGGVAALKDVEAMNQVKRMTIELRKKTTTELEKQGFPVIPSECNFFMVHLKRPVQPVIEAFRKQGVLVGRPFPPMTEHLRVSIGTAEEMDRFMVAWNGIMAPQKVT